MSMPCASASPTFSSAMRCLHRFDELRVDALGDDQAAGGGAALAGGEEGALHAQLDGGLEVGVVQHHLRVLAAHLELDFLQARGAGLGDARAHADCEPVKLIACDAGVIHQRVADDAAAAHDQVEHAGRDAACG